MVSIVLIVARTHHLGHATIVVIDMDALIVSDFKEHIDKAIMAADFLRDHDSPQPQELDTIIDELFDIQRRFYDIPAVKELTT